jgi:putative colanic acid biosynthesis acetyltransferase WcaF
VNTLNIAANRSAQKYTLGEQFRRVLWGGGKIFFRFSPRPCFGWRRFVLRCFGAKIGAHVNTHPSTRIYFPWKLAVGDWSAIGEDAFIYNLGQVTLGQEVVISQRAHICAGTHDYTRADLPILKPPIEIQNQAWVCADAFIGPGVVIGEGAVVGARSVVVKNVEPWMVVGGNPARVLKQRIMKS